MSKTLIDSAVATSAGVAEVLMQAGAIQTIAALYRRHFGDQPVCLLADANTDAAAGRLAEAQLRAGGLQVRCHILPATPRPKPSLTLAAQLAAVLAEDQAVPVVVGSGVLNDLVKHAAFALGRAYMCVATAASMDGYTSAGAPLTDHGFKKTIPCRPARVILADLSIIAAAPARMTGWGYGDLAGKIPAGADWILADAMGIEPIDAEVWPMVQAHLRSWLANPGQVASGDAAAIEGLFTGLTMIGLAMERHGSSRPASGADHQIAHLWEMDGLSLAGETVSHGACVAVGCTMTLRLYDWLLNADLSGLHPALLAAAAPSLAQKAEAITAAFGTGEIAARALAEVQAKHVSAGQLQTRLTLLARIWPDLRLRLQNQLVPADQMQMDLGAARVPFNAAAIGVDREYLRRTVLNARFLRSRYTILDLLGETGLLPAALEACLPV